MHNWTKVPAGTYHAFHNAWITHLQETLNMGLLPKDYYALGEQRVGNAGPDLLTLRVEENKESMATEESGAIRSEQVIALAQSPPNVFATQAATNDVKYYLQRQRRLVIRHASGDKVVAIIEIVSPANRHSAATLNDFADKVVECLSQGIHVVIVDPFPPGKHDPAGIHDFIWRQLLAGEYAPPADKPLTLVSYAAGDPIHAYIEPLAVGDPLTAVPLFLSREYYLPLPLEGTYQQAWQGMPAKWQQAVS